MLVYLDFFKGYFLQSRYIYKSYRFLDPHFTPMGRAYVKSSPWIELVTVQIFIDKVNLYKVKLGLICSQWYSGNRGLAAPVQDLSQQLPQPQIYLLKSINNSFHIHCWSIRYCNPSCYFSCSQNLRNNSCSYNPKCSHCVI